MASPDHKKSNEKVEIVKLWIPRRTEPANVSRDFWMPDKSCMVCYECDSQFTIFNRRHHCRLCGRVFCAKCTTNSVPSPSNEPKISGQEDWDRIRVCNYCFKQWNQESANGDGTMTALSPGLSPSPSSSSLVSTQSSCCSCNSNKAAGSAANSTEPFQHVSCAACQSPCWSEEMDSRSGLQDQVTRTGKIDYGDATNTFSDHFGPCCRSDNEDNEYPLYRSHCEATPLSPSDTCYESINHEKMGPTNEPHVLHSNEEHMESTCNSTLLLENLESETSHNETNRGEEANTVNNGVQPVAPNINLDIEAVDYENNALLWLPPEPADDEEETEAISSDDEDADEDARGEWGYLSSNSFNGGEFRSRERSNEEHRMTMKRVVDGHFKALISQLLQAENLPVGNDDTEENWLDIITTLSWEAATFLKPDTSMGGRMDPGEYVKVKCIACGHRRQSMVVKGVVCKKNVAHRRMTSKIDRARLLLLGGALEYQRVANHLSSFDTLLQQEMDHLKMAVAKIETHHPNVLLVEKSVSRHAQEYLLAKNISLVLNIKRPLLERIARCTGAQIVPSIDRLSAPKLGYCDSFHVEKFLEDLGSARQGGKKLTKTLMFFEGCPRPLGCTILLKGANGDELKKIKHVIHYSVFAAYHLALETSFLADEGASLPELPLKSPIKVALPDKPSGIDRSISIVPDPEKDKTLLGQIDEWEGRDYVISDSFLNSDQEMGFSHGDGNKHPLNLEDSKEVCLEQRDKEEFLPSPSDHQSILVSLSTRCVWKGSVCERAHIFRIKYYGSFDKPLGRFLRDNLFDQVYRCRCCEQPSEAHVHCYTHPQGSLTISVQKLSEFLLPGEREGRIWMWHRCLRCPRTNGFPPATKRVVMSDAAWGLSFGKFLELSFSNHAAASRVASCGHSLHRDCIRFYGFGRMVACFRYAPINVYSVYLPPSKLVFNHNKQEWIQKELDEIRIRAGLLFTEVSEVLPQIYEKIVKNAGAEAPEFGQQIAELELMLQKEKDEFEMSLRCLLNKEVKSGQPSLDILEINRIRRQLLLHSYVWDQRLIHITKSNLVNSRDNLTEKNVGPKFVRAFSSWDSSVTNGQINSPNGIDKEVYKKTTVTINSSNQPDSLVFEKIVRRARSVGQFPMTEDFTDNLETQPSEEIDMDNPNTWAKIPFSTLYQSFIKNLSTRGKISEYYPVYISSLRNLACPLSDSIVPVYDDEPTSVISYALVSPDYQKFMSEEPEKQKDSLDLSSFDESLSDHNESILSSTRSMSFSGLDTFLVPNSLHARVSFSNDGKVKYTVTCYFAKRFELLRRSCCASELEFVRSLSRCKNWGAQGGKSNVFFAKTLDERFIIKQVTKTELESFIKFAPAYFKYLAESIDTVCPTCLAKILGIYQVTSKHLKGGKETKMDVLVMENLLFNRSITRLYDLKGSTRSRYNPDSSGSNKVLLDQNLLEAMPTSPIFLGTKAKRLLERAVWNDTSFLASIDVMDYSLLVGVDDENNELVVGIIDFMRQYTWDKHLETWVKASGILGGQKNLSPTVISPKQYKKRFRKAMSAYFLMVPDQWSSSGMITGGPQNEENLHSNFSTQ